MPSASTNVLPLDVSAILAGAAICDDAIDVPRTRARDTAVNAIVFFMTPTPWLVASLRPHRRTDARQKFSKANRFHADQSGLFADICRKHDRCAFFVAKDELK